MITPSRGSFRATSTDLTQRESARELSINIEIIDFRLNGTVSVDVEYDAQYQWIISYWTRPRRFSLILVAMAALVTVGSGTAFVTP